MIPPHITLDAETWRIQERPAYPPRPVGWAIKWPQQPSRYWAFGHATNNNCTENEAKEALWEALQSPYFLLFHHAGFDLDVIDKWLGQRIGGAFLPWDRIHDTEFTAFLCDPHARSHGLKELATQHLNWPPDEKDEIATWVWDHRNLLEQETGIKVNRTKRNGIVMASNAFEFVPYVPGDLTGKYACGDTDRTDGIFTPMYEYIEKMGMMGAYTRERQLLPILMENEREGIRVDVDALNRDVQMYNRSMAHVEKALRTRLSSPNLNFDAKQDYANALINAGIVSKEDFALTPAGKLSTSKTNLTPDMFSDPHVASAVGYRNRLKTALTMFMEPWLRQGSARNGVVSTNWHQTRGGDGGTRTGRPSTSEPNLLNISKKFEGRKDHYVHPEFLGVPNLPQTRSYMLPDEGEYWLHRDFSGQEMRVFAHFEQGDLLAQFLANPRMDPHEFVAKDLARVTGDPMWLEDANRTFVKNINFGKLYGASIPRIMEVMSYTHAEAKALSEMHDKALPGRKSLNEKIVKAAKWGEAIRTIGGRVYFVEEPVFVDGRLYTFEYKLLNYLVQGSAADITKQAIIEWYHHPDRKARFLVTVYDEVNVSAPIGLWKPQMTLLRDMMNVDRLSCPMLSDGKFGTSWGKLEKTE